MAESEVKSAALWIRKLVSAEMKHLGGVRGKVEKLCLNLDTLATFLVEANKSRRDNNQVQAALLECRNVAYDCEDVIESYVSQVASLGYEQHEGFQLKTALPCAGLVLRANPLYEIRSRINKLSKRIASLRCKMESLGLPARINHSNDQQLTATALSRFDTREPEQSVVVGLDSQVTDLVDRLTDPNNKTIIVISGMGGVDKSTLARELYHHPKLREGGYFQAFGWATVFPSAPFEVLRTLLYSLVPENDIERRRKIEDDIAADLANNAVYQMMQELKCMVVIDDILTLRDWNMLQVAFPRFPRSGSRLVLTTTDKRTVSSLESGRVHIHPVDGLYDAYSWEIFEKITFPDACADSEKEELGQEMLKHCKGVPLAIGVFAKLLKTKKSVKEWQQISNDISAQIGRGGSNTRYKEVYDVLQVSYDDLPFHLKQCLLYFTSFPEDFKCFIDELYADWIAQGIVLKDDTNELEEDIADRYLKELASRNMVQLEYWDDRSTIISKCGIHDLMRDVCSEIASREGFLQQVNCHPSMLHDENVNHLLTTSLPQIDKRLRHLNVHVSHEHQEAQTSTLRTSSTLPSANISRAPNLRTLSICHAEDEEEVCTRLIETISQYYPLLRVLNCNDIPIKGKLPKKVGDLIHLRYLGLWDTHISEVPSSIEKLQLLQTLALESVMGVLVSIPNILWKLKQLRHLYLPYVALWNISAVDNPRYLVEGGGELQLDGLCNLQTLSGIDLDRVSVEGLSKLDRLRKVAAMCEAKREALSPFLNSTSLKELRLRLSCRVINEEPMILSACEALQLLVLHGREGSPVSLNKPLSLEMLPKSLISLFLCRLKLDADPLPVLEQLPNLEYLLLEYCDGLSVMACYAGGFPQLTELCFSGLLEFCSWEVEEGALPKLKELKIYNCPLKEAPDAIPSSVTVSIK